MKLSAIIPCYNEQDVIETSLSSVSSILENLASQSKIKNYDIIFVDDGSKDKTVSKIRIHAQKNPHVKLIKFSRNFGHQSAILAGYNHADGDVIVTLDADLQDPPEVIPKMLEKINEGNDIVYGVRESRNSDTFFKKITAKLFYHLLEKIGIDIIPDHAEFRMITKRALKAFLSFQESNLFIRATFPMIGFNSCIVYYTRPKRFLGKTKYTLLKMIDFAIQGVTSFSTIPLRLCSLFGFIISLLSLFMLFWSLIIKFTGGSIPGWASTVAPLYFLGGVQLIFLGVVGEYIGKIYVEVKMRPKYIIEEKINA